MKFGYLASVISLLPAAEYGCVHSDILLHASFSNMSNTYVSVLQLLLLKVWVVYLYP